MNWDLDCFFSGGSRSPALKNALLNIQQKITSLKTPTPNFQSLQELDEMLREVDAFVCCLESQNVEDAAAGQLRAEISQYNSELEQVNQAFDRSLSDLKTSDFLLQERKTRAGMQLSLNQEHLISSLSVDGYHGWGEFYPQLVAEVKVTCEIEGKPHTLSVGQAENYLSHPNRMVREQVFTAFENSWKQKEDLFASILNHIVGFRLNVSAKRGFTDPLQEPLFEYRMRKETLEAMWSVVDANKTPFLDFFTHKTPSLAWFDLDAPLETEELAKIPYKEAVDQIIAHFHEYHPGMAAFAKRACEEKWIEAEDRPGKRPGGFCISFPQTKMSRIFMTYSGTRENVSTLAHELGHAYHNEMVKDLPGFAQHYRMNIAEAASTFAEHLIHESILQNAKTPEEKRKILSDRIQRSAKYFLNIRARFLFDVAFHERRKTGFVSAEELSALMVEAQSQAYGNILTQYHPYFWASKLHFYFTEIPFYNFPYTFGYLFSLGLFQRAQQEGKAFMRTYDLLLKESGLMSIEDLAAKHLGVDLSQPPFWQEAMDVATRDVEAYTNLLNPIH